MISSIFLILTIFLSINRLSLALSAILFLFYLSPSVFLLSPSDSSISVSFSLLHLTSDFVFIPMFYFSFLSPSLFSSSQAIQSRPRQRRRNTGSGLSVFPVLSGPPPPCAQGGGEGRGLPSA
jgi:hypothetical protein